MTDLAPHSTHLPSKKPRPGWWRLGLLAGLGIVAASSASAQVQVGVTRAPSVSVDLGVLDDLGPAPNLPGLFGASHPYPTGEVAQTAPYRPVPPVAPKAATTKKQPAAPKRVAHRKPAAPQRASSSPQRVAAVSDGSVRLVAPTAAAAKAREDGVVTTPKSQATPVAAVGSPVPPQAPMPTLPQAEAAPPPPAVPPAPPHDAAAASPPSSPPAQATPDRAPTALTATPPTPVPAPATVAAAPVAPTTAATANPSPPSAPSSPVQLAAAASAGAAVNSVRFTAGATDLPSDAPPVLNKVAAKLLADDTLRVQLIAHATGNADQAMEARRVSLARAVAVRAYLIDKGVRSLRMDVRALGNRADDGQPGDQVDLLIVSQ